MIGEIKSRWRFILFATHVGWISTIASVGMCATTNWVNPLGGAFSTPANWSNGVPGPSDSAAFPSLTGQTITFTGSQSSNSADVQSAVFFAGQDPSASWNLNDDLTSNSNLTLDRLRLAVGDNVSFNGTITLLPGSELAVGNELGGSPTFNLSGGILTVKNENSLTGNASASVFAGTVNFSGDVYFPPGSAHYDSNCRCYVSDDPPVLRAFLPTSSTANQLLVLAPRTVSTGRTISVQQRATLTETFQITGGTFRVGSLANPSFLDFQSGVFGLINDDLLIGTSGIFGRSLSVGTGKSFQITRNTIVDETGILTLSGGDLSASMVTNRGDIVLDGGTSLLSGNSLINQGVIRGNGSIAVSLNNATTGTVVANSKQRLLFTKASNVNNGVLVAQSLDGGGVKQGEMQFTRDITNNGQINVSNGFFAAGGLAINSPGGFITGSGETALRFDGQLQNQGTLGLIGASAGIFGNITNTTTGTIAIAQSSNAVFVGNLINNGFVGIDAGSSALFLGDVSGSGNFAGGGSVEFVNEYSPGNSPASVTLQDDVTFAPSAEVKIELGGATVGTQYDHVQVTGQLSLGGTLKVTFLGSFVPSVGQSFDLLDWGSRVGTFSSLQLPTLASGTWNTSQLYTSGVLSVIAGLAGDYNHNGVVDAADYVVWRKTDGTPGGFNTWRANFGSTLGSGSAAGTGLAPVPEPASWALVGMAFVGALGRRRRGGA